MKVWGEGEEEGKGTVGKGGAYPSKNYDYSSADIDKYIHGGLK